MTNRQGQILRAATILVFIAAGVLFVRMVVPQDAAEEVEPRQGELDVADAISVAGQKPLAVRGYVFKGPGGLGLRLCDGKQNGSPPRCLGPFVDLYQVDEGSFGMKSAKTDDGEVKWVPDPLTIRGTIVGTAMTVSEVLQ
jgi:hypothetical protein